MSAIVRDANLHLEATGGEKIFLHGYWFTAVDEAGGQGSSLFMPGAGAPVFNEDYLLKGSYFASSERLGSHDIVFGYDQYHDKMVQNNHQ